MKLSQTWYEYILLGLSVLLISLYSVAYVFASASQYKEKYLPLVSTARTLVLASFLIYFYNPLRTEYEYGHALPLFAFTAGITLLFLLGKYEILNLAHFLLYGKTLPEHPIKVCTLEQSATESKV